MCAIAKSYRCRAVFFDVDFLPEDFLVVLFFFAVLFFAPFFGILAPDLRASLRPIAIACFGFFTFPAFPPDPDFNSWCLNSCIVFCIFLRTILLDLGSEPEDDFFELVFVLVAIVCSLIYWREA